MPSPSTSALVLELPLSSVLSTRLNASTVRSVISTVPFMSTSPLRSAGGNVPGVVSGEGLNFGVSLVFGVVVGDAVAFGVVVGFGDAVALGALSGVVPSGSVPPTRTPSS